MNLPDGTHLAYVVAHEAWYNQPPYGRGARAVWVRLGGEDSTWEFAVEEADLPGAGGKAMADLRCEDYADGYNPAAGVCGVPAVAIVTTACVHEHVNDMPYCGRHLDELRAGAGWLCSHCYDGPQSHDCPATITVRDLEAHRG